MVARLHAPSGLKPWQPPRTFAPRESESRSPLVSHRHRRRRPDAAARRARLGSRVVHDVAPATVGVDDDDVGDRRRVREVEQRDLCPIRRPNRAVIAWSARDRMAAPRTGQLPLVVTDRQQRVPALIPQEVAGSHRDYPAVPATAVSKDPAHGGNPRLSPVSPQVPRPVCHAGGSRVRVPSLPSLFAGIFMEFRFAPESPPHTCHTRCEPGMCQSREFEPVSHRAWPATRIRSSSLCL